MAKKITDEQKKVLKGIKEAYQTINMELMANIEIALDIEPEIDMDDYNPDRPDKTRAFVIRVARDAYLNDEKDVIEKLEELFKEEELPSEMIEAIENLKDNPIEEPLLDLSDKEEVTDSDIYKAIEEKTKLKRDNFTAEQWGAFTSKVINKVNSLRGKDKKLKTTENTNKIKLLNPTEATDLKDIAANFLNENINSKQYIGQTADYIAKKRKIDIKEMTLWEKKLITEHIYEQLNNISKSFIGGFI